MCQALKTFESDKHYPVVVVFSLYKASHREKTSGKKLPRANSFISRGKGGQPNLCVSNPHSSYVLFEFMASSWFDINLPGRSFSVRILSKTFLCCGVCSLICEWNAHKYVGNAAGCAPFHPWNSFPTASEKRCVSLQSRHTFKLIRCKISRPYNLKTPTNEAKCVNIQNIWPFSQSILFTCRLAHCQVHIV